MSDNINIKTALISVFHKQGLERILPLLKELGVKIYSTGGTLKYIEDSGFEVEAVEDLTGYPSICDGRVKTLHPAVFAGILARKDHQGELDEYKLPRFDLVIVDLYPFEETVRMTSEESQIIEKIDIGGISLIRAAAKNYKNCLIVPSQEEYPILEELLNTFAGQVPVEQSKKMAARAFRLSNHYDNKIFHYLNTEVGEDAFTVSESSGKMLRYGENPHQQGLFYGDLDSRIEQLQGKELSYNNLVDMEAAIDLIEEFPEDQNAFAVIKHTNACGLAIGDTVVDSWKKALAGDPISAFGGVLISNQTLDEETVKEIQSIFFELLIVRDITPEALAILAAKKNPRRVIKYKGSKSSGKIFKSLLNGVLVQDKDSIVHETNAWKDEGGRRASDRELKDLYMANIAVKHLKSNAICLVKDQQLIGIGCGQTSRIDALEQAIAKAIKMELTVRGSVMASDAFFPFSDCIQVAHEAGISAVVQPGGSIRDKETIDYAVEHNLSLMITGKRHFKH